jgi:hypothetical protein
MHRYKQSGAMLLICWGSCPKCITVGTLISYLQTCEYFQCNFPTDFMNKWKPKCTATFFKMPTDQIIFENRMATVFVWLIGSDVCVFLKVNSFRFTEDNPENFISPVGYPGRHLQWHNIKILLLFQTQRVTHSFSIVKQYLLTPKWRQYNPLKHPDRQHIP